MITVEKSSSRSEYVGRPSLLGNPFKPNSKLDSDRDMVCDMFERFFAVAKFDKGYKAELDRLQAIAEAGDLVLGCWCAPKRCHADTIKRYLDDAIAAKRDIFNES